MADITITHTRADGTLVDGSSKGDGVYQLMSPHGFRYSRNLGQIYLPRSRDQRAQSWRIDAARAALEAAGHTVAVEIDEDKRRSFAEAEEERNDQAVDRSLRYGARAGRAQATSDAQWEQGRRIGHVLQGEPIKVGHHSEGRHRRDLERMDTLARKSMEGQRTAEYLAGRSEAAAHFQEHRENPPRTLRRITTTNTFDAYGKISTVSQTGDTAKTGDEQCTTTTYARNTGANILTLVAETKTVAVTCGTTPSLPADLIADQRIYYDKSTTLGAAPTLGNITRTDEQDGQGTGFITTATAGHDQYGRVTTSTDAAGATTTTQYTPPTGAAPVTTLVTNDLGHTTTTTDDPVRGIPVAEVDANTKRTEAVYDALGRLLKVWRPGWTKADHPSAPSNEYSYSVSATAPVAVMTKTLEHTGAYRTEYALYDGMLRPRQTSAPAPGGGQLLTETRYDTRGWAWKTAAAYYTTGNPSPQLLSGGDNTIPNMTVNTYDGTGRVTDAVSYKFGDQTWRTTTVYGGDRTTVIPPKGGTAKTTLTDALGRATELWEYTDSARLTHQTTSYTYDKRSKLHTVTDPAGNTWTYTNDARGRQTVAEDPDKGKTSTTFDNADRPVTTTDAFDVTLTTVYDKLGRKTDLKQGSTALAKWTYDTVAKGQLTTSTRYIGTAAYTTTVDSYNDRYQPTSTTVTIPAGKSGISGTYNWTYGYDVETGALEWTKQPLLANLPSERVTTVLDDSLPGDLPLRTTAGGVNIVGATSYDSYARPVRTEFGPFGAKVYKTQTYDEHTGRLTGQTTDRDLAPQRIDDVQYAYDDAGNVTGITTASGQDAAKTTDTQCFTTDTLARLTEAWTTTSTACPTTPTASTVGGPDAYWRTYSYDAVGNRTKEVQHTTTSGPAADITRTYTHPDPGTARPHAVQTVTATGGATGTDSFQYDKAGNTTTRTVAGTTQTLTWDTEGHLSTLTSGGKTTTYTYDADGNRLLSEDSTGSRTLYLPGGNELTSNADGTVKTALRYYTHGGQTVAVRTKDGISYLFSDQQGTALTAVAAGTLAITRRKQLPFGETRSAQGAGRFQSLSDLVSVQVTAM
ncbi:DUF3560 domain-containing protein [Actinacidiphila glaucinigra]|uniref:DUF3560 domain-containing protein n=1 Tax=Actinacidiphila glaucinigra TaxID=235986 RepID=UPI0037AC573D